MRYSQRLAEKFNLSGKISQSFYGEDIMLWRYFLHRNIRNGFFIDVGAYHPKFCNNTWRLRKKLGFKGINIEPTDRINLFRKYRGNDINLKCLIGEEEGAKVLNYVTKEPGVSGTDRSKMVLEADKEIKCFQTTLTRIISEHKVIEIDLLDIDIEGSEMEVLNGYDWSIMPRLILIEDDKDKEGEIDHYLTGHLDYEMIACTFNNTLYEHQEELK